MPEASQPFICAYHLDPNAPSVVATAAEVDAWTPESGLIWVHLDVLDDSHRDWLNARTDIDDVTKDLLLAGETRPRSVSTDKGHLLILRGVNTNPGADPDDMVSVRIWIDANRIITSRRRRLLSIIDVREAIESGRGPATTGEFVVMLVGRLADRIGGVVDDIEEYMATAEEHSLDEDLLTLRTGIGEHRRQTAAIRRYLAPQRDALDRMYRQPGGFISDTEANELREEADRITRYLEDLDLIRERAIMLQEELLGRLAHEQNTRIYVLSVVAAVFLPLTFVTGLFGMNIGGLPGIDVPAAFWLSLFGMGTLSAALVLFFRWKRWI